MRRRADQHGIDIVENLAVIGDEPGNGEFLNARGRGRADIRRRDDLYVAASAEKLREMRRGNRAAPDDSDTELAHESRDCARAWRRLRLKSAWTLFPAAATMLTPGAGLAHA